MPSIEDMLFGTILKATGAEPAYRGYSAAKNTLAGVEDTYNTLANDPSVQFALRQGGLLPPDPGESPTPVTPTTPPGTTPPQINFPEMQKVGIQESNRTLNAENNEKARRDNLDRAYYASQGMQYYAPGVGYKGDFAQPGGSASAFGQSYTPTQGTYSNGATAKGGEYEQQILHDIDMQAARRELESATASRALETANLSPMEAAKINALSRTQFKVDPVQQEAFKQGQRIIAMRQAALAKAQRDAGGDPEKFARAKSYIDQQFGDFDYSDLLAWALGQRNVGANPYGNLE